MSASASSIRIIWRSTNFRHRCTLSKSLPTTRSTTRRTRPLVAELPPRARDVTIDFTALSFVAPEKVRFRYKLEGQESELARSHQRSSDAIHEPRSGELQLPASAANNNSGVWNEDGAMLEFSIAPAFYQTRWFQARDGRPARSRWCGRAIASASVKSHGNYNDAGRARQRADAHRAGAARYAAAELPRTAAAIPDRLVPAAGAPGRRQRATGWRD